jgi:hypothetical protein
MWVCSAAVRGLAHVSRSCRSLLSAKCRGFAKKCKLLKLFDFYANCMGMESPGGASVDDRIVKSGSAARRGEPAVMVRTYADFDIVREIGLTLPDVVESTMYGAPALKVRGKLLACVPVNRSAEPNCAVFRIDFERRAALIEAHPEIYYITDHYADHPTVLVRLSRIGPDKLRDLFDLALQFVSSSKPARSTGSYASRAARGARSPRRGRPKSGNSGGRRR